MDYYLKIKNDRIVKIYNDSYVVVDGILGRYHPKDNRFIPEGNVDLFTKITFVKSRQSIANSKRNYVLDGDSWRLKTDEELAEEKKPKEKAAAFNIHREIVKDMRVEANGELYAFDHFSMLFFLAEYSLNGQNGFEWKPKGKAERMHSTAEVTAIFTAARNVIRDSFTAYNFDRLDILNDANFDKTRLKAEKDKQKALKAE